VIEWKQPGGNGVPVDRYIVLKGTREYFSLM
jgi:hypothetical protein